MNYLLKNAKNHQKTSSDINSKSKKKIIPSSAIVFKSNLLNTNGNIITTSIKKNYINKGRKILGIKNNMKINNKNTSESNTEYSNKKILINEFNANEESKGDIDIYDETSTNNLTSTAINNESLSNTNTYFKRNILSSSKNINNNLKNNSLNNLDIKNEFNLKNINIDDNNYIYNKKNSVDFLSVFKSQSNKEITNSGSNNNINDNTNNSKTDITQRCRHKQVKREIYINNNSKKKDNHIINSMRKIKMINNLEDNKTNETEIIKNSNNLKDNNNNVIIPITKINKNTLSNNTKKQQSLLELYGLKNKPTKKIIKNEDLNSNNKENIENNNKNNEDKNVGCLKSSTINYKIKRIKSPYLNFNYNYINKETNKNNIFNNNEIIKTKDNNNPTNDNIVINKCKSINKINIEQKDIKSKNENLNNNNEINNSSHYSKKQYKRIKNYTHNNNQFINNQNNVKKRKENNDLCFDEDELDENTLSVANGKYIENKKCQTMINKVLHFETGSNEIFNNFKVNNNINSINKMSFLIKNQSTKSMKEKKNSCNTIINGNNLNNKNNNNIKNINIIIRNNIDYNLKKKKKLKNENYFKKCNTDVLMDNTIDNKERNNYDYFYYQENNKNNNNSEDNINQQFYSSGNNNTFIKTNKNNINNNKNLVMHKRLKYINYNNNKLKLFYKIFQNDEFKILLFNFCDIHLLNKVCLISKQIYIYMKPLIYNKINKMVYKNNKNSKNLKIKKYLMENFSPLSKFSPAVIRKKYTDLKFENNHKYDTEIKKDLTRTFPDNILFKYGNIYYNKLYHVLTAFSNYNKNIGYTQGLNFLAAHIIYLFDEEIEEFIFLDSIIHKFDLEKILCTSNNNNFFIKILEDITKYIKQKLPKLSKYLTEIKLNFEFFTTNWVLTLFSNSMETNNLFFVWDYMIIFGWKFFRCFVVAVLMIFENEILKASQDNITYIMKNMLKNKQFNSDFETIILSTIQMLIKE